jgi:hypothetical protein
MGPSSVNGPPQCLAAGFFVFAAANASARHEKFLSSRGPATERSEEAARGIGIFSSPSARNIDT